MTVAHHHVDTVQDAALIPKDMAENAKTAANRVDFDVRKLPQKQVETSFGVAEEVVRRTVGLVMERNKNEPPALLLKNPVNLIHDIEGSHDMLQHRVAEHKIEAIVGKWKRLSIEVAHDFRLQRAVEIHAHVLRTAVYLIAVLPYTAAHIEDTVCLVVDVGEEAFVVWLISQVRAGFAFWEAAIVALLNSDSAVLLWSTVRGAFAATENLLKIRLWPPPSQVVKVLHDCYPFPGSCASSCWKTVIRDCENMAGLKLATAFALAESPILQRSRSSLSRHIILLATPATSLGSTR
jgi:hypothetical protein